jgi:DNA-binding NtrC family response regulator
LQPFSVPVLPSNNRLRPRTALVASADRSFRQRLSKVLTGLRWQVREADGGAQAWTEAESAVPEAIIVDTWLPDLDLSEFLGDFHGRFPDVDVVTAAGSISEESPRGPYRQELLYALRHIQETDTAPWNGAPGNGTPEVSAAFSAHVPSTQPLVNPQLLEPVAEAVDSHTGLPTPIVRSPASFLFTLSPGMPRTVPKPESSTASPAVSPIVSSPIPSRAVFPSPASESGSPGSTDRLPELVGNAPCMLEVGRRVRLVAPRMTPVLIEGPTGSGKELVAEALHRLSPRNRKPFITLNCAAIPESLLEAELFGHTRGAFTGAVQGRVGRIETADGGTLFLDEIGEMPLALQSKLLRFVECGELQRVGDNQTVKVDVRIVAATHRPLSQQAQNGGFRSDLYYRLAVFLIRTPSLAEHPQDLPILIDHFMQKLGRDTPVKRLDEVAMARLAAHDWPGNVRELEHVLERGVILAGDNPVLTEREIDFGFSVC